MTWPIRFRHFDVNCWVWLTDFAIAKHTLRNQRMIGKIKKGKGFRGLLNYSLQKQGAKIVGGNMAGADARVLAQEFSVFRALKPGLGRAVFHSALSLPDGESLTDSQWGQAAEQYARDMGFGDSAWLAVRHRDAEHDHIHFIASRITKNGDVVNDGQDYKRQEKTIREIEKTFGLTPLNVNQKPTPNLSQGEIGKAERTGQLPAKLMIAAAIDQAIEAGVKDEGELATELSKSNIDTQIHAASTGRVSGLSFRLHGEIEWLKGSSIGKAYSHLNIKKRIELQQHTPSPKNGLDFIDQKKEQAHEQPDREATDSDSSRALLYGGLRQPNAAKIGVDAGVLRWAAFLVGINPPPQARNHLRGLSELGVVQLTDDGAVLLPRDVPDHMDQQSAERNDSLRWRSYGERAGIDAILRKRIEEHGKNKRHAADGSRQGEAHTVGSQPAGREVDANAATAQGAERIDPLDFLDDKPATSRDRGNEEGHDRGGAADQVAAVSNRYPEKLDQAPAALPSPVAATGATLIPPQAPQSETDAARINRIKRAKFLLVRRDPLQRIPVEVLDGLEGVTDAREAMQTARTKGLQVIEYPGEIQNFRAGNDLVDAVEHWKANKIIEMREGEKEINRETKNRRQQPQNSNRG